MFDPSQFNRWGMDYSLATTSIYGVSPYSAWLVQITNTQVDINDTDANEVITSTRITVANGYASYSSLDGYLNPQLEQEDGSQITISNGQLTANRLLLGPVVFPYTVPANGGILNGGIDPTIFQPPIGNNNNLNVYVQIRGESLSPTGNLFDIAEIVIDNMSGLSYQVLLKSNNITLAVP